MMNTQNKEDIPTRNFKKKKNNKNILNWRQTTFHVEQKQQQKKNEKNKQKKTKNNNNNSQRNIEKFSNSPADLTSGKQNGRGISLSKTLSFNTFSLPNLQNKVTFFF